MTGRLTAATVAEVMGINFLPSQLDAIGAPLEPGVIIAGAGSGKTTVMAARVVYLVGNGEVAPGELLGLTFTNLATGELQQRIRKALGLLRVSDLLPVPSDSSESEQVDEPEISTYHAFASRIVSEQGLWLGLEPDSLVVADARRQQLAAQVLRSPRADVAALGKAFDTVMSAMLAMDDALADADVSTDEWRAYESVLAERLAPLIETNKLAPKLHETSLKRQIVADLVDEFRAEKRLREFVDYADMTRYALNVIRTNPVLADGYREQYKVVLLDEYQDTSVAQRNLMRALFGGGHPVTAVGDPFQCIYSWRGASPTNIDLFPSHFPTAAGQPATVYKLPVTQRNGADIVSLANCVSDPLRAIHPDIPEMQPPAKPAFGPGRVRIAEFDLVDAEADWLADQLRAAAANGVAWEEMALLLRKNDDISRLHGLLSDRGIPVQVRSRFDLLDVPEVAEAIAILRIIAEPAANAAWVRVLTGARWRIGNRDLALIGAHATRLSVRNARPDEDIDAALAAAVADVDLVDLAAYGDAVADIAERGLPGLSADAVLRLQRLDEELRHLRAHTGEPLVEFTSRVLRTTGLLAEAAAAPDRVAAGMGTNLRTFTSMVASFVSIDGGSTLFDLLDWIDAGIKYQSAQKLELAAHPGAVQLMTVHAAKGLQYRVVGLPRLAEGVFPAGGNTEYWVNNLNQLPLPLLDEPLPAELNRYPDPLHGLDSTAEGEFQAAIKQRRLLDERRLIYVAVTRTTDLLLVSTSARTHGNSSSRPPSVFFEELRDTAREMTGDITISSLPAESEVDQTHTADRLWPVTYRSADVTRALAAEVLQAMTQPDTTASTSPMVSRWDQAITALEREVAMAGEPRQLRLPESLSVSGLQHLAADPDDFLAQLLRPMPRPPSRAADLGTAFHAWVEKRARQLAGPGLQARLPIFEDEMEELPVMEPAELQKLQANFEKSEWGSRPVFDIEVPISVRFAGRTVHGRIDAVYREDGPDGDRYEIVDWKTNRAATADALQLALYVRAWSEMHGIDPSRIRAGFFYVAICQMEWPDLPDLAEFERILASGSS